MRQVEVSRHPGLRRPPPGPGFFEALVGDNIGIGHPHEVHAVFGGDRQGRTTTQPFATPGVRFLEAYFLGTRNRTPGVSLTPTRKSEGSDALSDDGAIRKPLQRPKAMGPDADACPSRHPVAPQFGLGVWYKHRGAARRGEER